MDPGQCCKNVNPACHENIAAGVCVQLCWVKIGDRVPSNIPHLLLVPVTPARTPGPAALWGQRWLSMCVLCCRTTLWVDFSPVGCVVSGPGVSGMNRWCLSPWVPPGWDFQPPVPHGGEMWTGNVDGLGDKWRLDPWPLGRGSTGTGEVFGPPARLAGSPGQQLR